VRLLAALLLTACPGRRPLEVPADVPIASANRLNTYLYTGDELEAASLVGRFVSGEFPLDYRDTETLNCSEYFAGEYNDAGFDKTPVFSTTQAGAAVAGIDVGKAQRVHDGFPTYVKFEPSGTTFTLITNPQALQQCCLASAEQCGKRYVSALYHGTADVYWKATDGEWHRGTKLSGVVGFAVAENPFAGAGCGAWMDKLPATRNGQFFHGKSALLSSEERATEASLYDARQQARRWIQREGLGDSLLSTLADFKWCIQEIPNQTGTVDYRIDVLTYLQRPE
jgi:hypothetical protein